MAEQVQAVLDGMVPALMDLQERQILSPDEIRATVARRRESEYLLRRRHARKSDFLHYLQQEMSMEKLRKLRVQRLKQEEREASLRDQNNNNNNQPNHHKQKETKHIGDRHIVQHIHLLWIRTLRKFRADVNLFHQYAEFCRETKSLQRLAQCHQDALRYHPHHLPFWLEAASHEFFAQGSVRSARILLQRALRLHPESHDLWVQSLALELHWVQKLRGRRAILLGTTATAAATSQETAASGTSDPYELARLVYCHAIQSKADCASLRLQCLELCRDFPSDTMELQKTILQSIQRDCTQDASAWMARALYAAAAAAANRLEQEQQLPSDEPALKRQKRSMTEYDNDNHDAGDPVLEILREACRTVKTEEMVLQVVQFLQSYYYRDNATTRKQQSTHDKTVESDGEDDDREGESLDDENEQSQPNNNERNDKSSLNRKAAAALTREILQEAVSSDYYTPTLVLLHADFMEQIQQDKLAAMKILESYIADCQKKKAAVVAAIWIRLACLRYQHCEPRACLRLLEEALDHFPLCDANKVRILLALLGARLRFASSNSKDDPRLAELFQQLLLLAPASTSSQINNDRDERSSGAFEVFQNVVNVPMACLQYWRYQWEMASLEHPRTTVADDVLLNSTTQLRHQLVATDFDAMKSLVDEVLEAQLLVDASATEKANRQGNKKRHRQRLARLYEVAIDMFRGTPLAAEYKEQRDERVRYSSKANMACPHRNSPKDSFEVPFIDMKNVPVFDADFLESLYKNFQILVLRNAGVTTTTARRDSKRYLCWGDLAVIFEQLNDEDKESWCIETKGDESSLPPKKFLGAKNVRNSRAYCSFLIQNDKEAYKKVLGQLPFQEIPATKWNYEPALWVFFGRNPLGNNMLNGRPDHTDSVSHDGTFHFQLSGRKQWSLKPTTELVSYVNDRHPELMFSNDTRLRLTCEQGDAIIINTRLWFHCTTIPPQASPSVSYARDFRLEEVGSPPSGEDQTGAMKNLDGLYATNDIDEGTIIFSEVDMPDCELHRSSTNPNCEVVELEDGTSVVVSRRAIAAGEFFCIAESSSDESGSSSDEESTSNDAC